MKVMQRFLIGVVLVIALGIAWVAAFNFETDLQRQARLVGWADNLIEDKIYIRAMPFLEEAYTVKSDRTPEIVEKLKQVYYQLKYMSSYEAMLDIQMAADDATSSPFLEAAAYKLERNRYEDAFTVMKSGITRTNCEELTAYYEKTRYTHSFSTLYYLDVSAIFERTIMVCSQDNLWGIIDIYADEIIPCEYDKISTYSNRRAIVSYDGEVFSINRNNQRDDLLKSRDDDADFIVGDFGNFNGTSLPVQINGKWVRVRSGSNFSQDKTEFEYGTGGYEEMGMITGGYAAVKENGKWGLIAAVGGSFAIAAEYDDIIRDELGISFSQNAVFAKKGNQVFLYVLENGEFKRIDGVFEDARVFNADGWAAVKLNGKWCFIDTAGEIKLELSAEYEDALSFSGHLAAVKKDSAWGYVCLKGNLVIYRDPQDEDTSPFIAAKSFSNGRAPVQTESGWGIITLREFE